MNSEDKKVSLLTKVLRVLIIIKDTIFNFLDKCIKKLTNNFIVRIKDSHLYLFSKIKIRITKKRRDAFYGLMFVGIWIIGYAIFTFYPMIHSFYLSFTRAFYNVQTGINTEYLGFVNYLNIFRSNTLLPLYFGYITKTIFAVPIIIIFSIIIAMLINQPIKGKGIWRTIFFLPVIISSGPIINELINQGATSLPSFEDNQALTFIFDSIGSWIADPIQAILGQLLLILWYAGVPILIFLAGLQKIDKALYEASSIDGASPWDNFWNITLPSIKPFITVNVIYVVVSMSMFVEPGGILDLARTHMIAGSPDSTMWFGYGYSSAISWIYFFLMVIIIGIFVGLLNIKKKGDKE